MQLAPVVFALLVPIFYGTGEVPPVDANLEQLLVSIGENSRHSGDELLDGVPSRLVTVDPGVLIARVATEKGSVSGVVDVFEKELSLPRQAAEPLARALIRWRAFRLRPVSAPHQAILDDLKLSIRFSEGALVPTLAAARFVVYDLEVNRERRFARVIKSLLPEVPALPRTLVTIAQGRLRPEVLLMALEAQPELLLDAVMARPGMGIPALMPSYDAALRQVLLKREPSSAQTAAVIANAKLGVLLGAGLGDLAIEAFEGLPANVREQVLRGPKVPGSMDDHPRRAGRRLTLDLAQAYLIKGNKTEAARLLDLERTLAASEPRREDEPDGERLSGSLIEAALHPERDPFEALVFHRSSSPLSFQVTLLVGVSYPRLLEKPVRAFRREPSPFADDGWPRESRATARLEEALAKLRASVLARAEAVLAAGDIEPATAPSLEHLLSRPPRYACRSRFGAPSASESKWRDWRAPGFDGFTSTIGGSREKRRAVLLISNEQPRLWVTLSEDAGETWSKPVTLGHLPGRIRGWTRRTNVSVEGDTLRFDSEHGPDRVVGRYVPVEGPPELRRVTCSLSALREDSDGDGLTDVHEEWLVTDPESSDSDGDGLADGEDPMPQVPRDGQPSLRAKVLLHSLSFRAKTGMVLDDVGPTPGPEKLAGDTETFLVVGERAEFRGLSPAHRVIVLSENEAAQFKKRWKRSFHGARPSVVTNHAGTMAVIGKHGRIAGIEYLLRKERDGWHVLVLFELIV